MRSSLFLCRLGFLPQQYFNVGLKAQPTLFLKLFLSDTENFVLGKNLKKGIFDQKSCPPWGSLPPPPRMPYYTWLSHISTSFFFYYILFLIFFKSHFEILVSRNIMLSFCFLFLSWIIRGGQKTGRFLTPYGFTLFTLPKIRFPLKKKEVGVETPTYIN